MSSRDEAERGASWRTRDGKKWEAGGLAAVQLPNKGGDIRPVVCAETNKGSSSSSSSTRNRLSMLLGGIESLLTFFLIH